MKKPRVFFNASVILSGINSPKGGSAKLLSWVKQQKIKGVISEIILGEALRHAPKFHLEKKSLEEKIKNIFFEIISAPDKVALATWKEIVIDSDDTHLFVSAMKTKCDFLVSLDKKHVLILKDKIKNLKIVSPAELIEQLEKDRRRRRFRKSHDFIDRAK